MKKFRRVLLSIALIACTLPAHALANSSKMPAYAGDLVKSSATVYSDAGLKNPIGKVPGCTAVIVKAFLKGKYYQENKASLISYKGKKCYIQTSKLLYNNYVASRDVTLAKGTRIYQRPSKRSASFRLGSKKTVWLIGVKGKWALIREATADYDGRFGFVKYR